MTHAASAAQIGTPEAPHKACPKCLEVLPYERFCKDKQTKTGRKSRCKSCVAVDKREWRGRNPDKARLWHQAWADKNRGRVNQSADSYRQKNRDVLKQRSAAWRQDNPHYVSQYGLANRARIYAVSKAWAAKNRAKVIGYATAKRERGGEEFRAAARRKTILWRRANPDRVSFHQALNRVRRAPAGWADKSEIFRVYAKRRAMSHSSEGAYAVDHVYPIKGRTVSGLHVEANLRVITAKDNSRKYNHLPGELAQELWDPNGLDVYYLESHPNE